jgi:hypothetical protein
MLQQVELHFLLPQVTWAGRLVNSSKLLSLKEQKALLALAADVPDGPRLLAMADELGGIQRIVLRFHADREMACRRLRPKASRLTLRIGK